MKKSLFLLTGLLSLSFSANAEGVRASRLLLSSFANQCPQVVTRNVSATLVNLQALHGAVEEIKKDTNCHGAASLSAIVSRYNGLYEKFEVENTGRVDQSALEKRIAYYTTLLNSPGIDAGTQSYLQTEIISAQAELVNVNQGLARFQNFSGKEARVANQLVSAVDSFLTELQTTQGEACYAKHSAKISNIMSNALLVTAAFASGGTSLALAGGAVITKSVGNYIGDMKENRTLEAINDIEMPTALRCVSQALTDQYCSAVETQSLISERIDSNGSGKTAYDGINLLSFQMNPLSKWLVEVYSGSNITSEGDLINREKPELQAEFLRQVGKYLDAYGTIKANFFVSLDDPEKRSTAIIQSIDCMVGLFSAPSLSPCEGNGFSPRVENPIFTTYSRSMMAYNLFEPGVHKSTPYCPEDQMPCQSFSRYVNTVLKKTLTIKDWENVLKEADRIVNSTKDLVNIERSKTISVDAYAIIVNAKRDYKGETSPYRALKLIVRNADRITAYLQSKAEMEGDESEYSDQITNIAKTRLLTTQIISLIDEGTIPRTIPSEVLPSACRVTKSEESSFINTGDILEDKSFQITSCISKLLKLQERGNTVYVTKVRNMVSYEMEARLMKNDLGDGVRDLVNSTKLDLVQSILDSYSSGTEHSVSTGELDIALETAQNNSEQTLIVFFDFFKKNLVHALTENKISKSERFDLCFRVLPYLPHAKDSVVKDVALACQDAEFRVYKNGPSIKFSSFVQVTPKQGLRPAKVTFVSNNNQKKLFCAYREYNRANLLIDEQNRQARRR